MRLLNNIAIAVTVATLAVPTFARVVAAQTLRVGLIEDVDTLDPAQGRTLGGRQVFAAMCDKLFDIDQNGNLYGQLATKSDTSDNGLKVRLTLRQGVKFQDGTPFNAEAVKLNLDRDMSMAESARKGDLRAIDHVNVVDDHTIDLVLKEPYTPLLAQLADRAGMMLSPTAIKGKDAKTVGTHPVCSGPFQLVEQIPQDHITLKRFDGYWDADKIHVDEVIYRPMPDATVRLNNLLSGQLDLISQVATSDLPQLRSASGFQVASVTGLGHFHLIFNLASDAGPFATNVKLRQAVDAAIDRNIINKVVFKGEFVPGNQPVSPSSPYYDKDHPVTGAHLDNAKKLIAESGVSSPSLKIVVNNNPVFLRVAQVIQSMLGEAGIKVTLDPMDSKTATGVVTSGKFQGFFSFWSGRVDPDANTYTYLGCKGSQNSGGYCNADVEKLLTQAAAESKTEDRAALYAKAADSWMADAPMLFLYHPKLFFGLSDSVHDFKPIPDGLIRLQGVSMEK
jgi:peptide/nickel transport system substrate-binding protein